MNRRTDYMSDARHMADQIAETSRNDRLDAVGRGLFGGEAAQPAWISNGDTTVSVGSIRPGDVLTLQIQAGDLPLVRDPILGTYHVNLKTDRGKAYVTQDKIVGHRRGPLRVGDMVIDSHGSRAEVVGERRAYPGGDEIATWSATVGYQPWDADEAEGWQRV